MTERPRRRMITPGRISNKSLIREGFSSPQKLASFFDKSFIFVKVLNLAVMDWYQGILTWENAFQNQLFQSAIKKMQTITSIVIPVVWVDTPK